MQKGQQVGTGSNRPTWGAAMAETAYVKSRNNLKCAIGSILEHYGISIADAKTGVVEASHR
jgi:hypothetical protein